MGSVRCREIVRFSEGPLWEVRLYILKEVDNKQRKPLTANERRERRRAEGIIEMSQQKERSKQCTNTQGKEPLSISCISHYSE